MSRTNSSTKASGSSTLKVRMRRWPNVPDAVTTLRARNTSGMVVVSSAPASAGSVSTSAWTSESCWSTACGANSSARARPTSSANRSSPIEADVVVGASASAMGGTFGPTSQGWRSSWRTPRASR
ncbi:hypothetical protein [Geodermatophilus sp. URMC 65]